MKGTCTDFDRQIPSKRKWTALSGGHQPRQSWGDRKRVARPPTFTRWPHAHVGARPVRTGRTGRSPTSSMSHKRPYSKTSLCSPCLRGSLYLSSILPKCRENPHCRQSRAMTIPEIFDTILRNSLTAPPLPATCPQGRAELRSFAWFCGQVADK